MNKPSALQQAISALNAGTNAVNKNVVQPLEKVDLVAASKKLFDDYVASKQNRRQKSSYPIASLRGGDTLFSDGTVQRSEGNRKLDVLKQNVIDQNAFTPQAKAYIQKIPVGTDNNPDALGTYDVNARSIYINPQLFKLGRTLPTEVMMHEMLHALDRNANFGDTPASFLPQNASSADSFGFYPELKDDQSAAVQNQIDQFLSSYPPSHRIDDQEAFAQYGATRGNGVLLQPSGDRYSAIFAPESKNTNYSPVFPTKDAFSTLLSQLSDENNIK